ncbi:MAG TPA: hypothetical protein VN519_15545 [Bryobacteraceae bacterium]|nr:hypothetical protein [Bryobacteraceae bacterium]
MATFPLDELRRRQQDRLLPAMDAWNEAKKNLEAAIALAALREREYVELSKDVRRRLDALQLVLGMAQELEGEPPQRAAFEPEVRAIGEPPAQTGVMRTSSKKLFPAGWRARYASVTAPGD